MKVFPGWVGFPLDLRLKASTDLSLPARTLADLPSTDDDLLLIPPPESLLTKKSYYFFLLKKSVS